MYTHAKRAIPIHNLMESVDSFGFFTSFRKALDTAGLTMTLSGSGPYTVFAPDDRAFGKLPVGLFDVWLEPGNRTQLISLLAYHVFPGHASSADIGTMSHPKMLQGQSTVISKDGNHIKIDGAQLIAVDIASSNGVIHMIDTVIQPAASNRH